MPQTRILMLCWNFPPALGGIENVADHLSRSWFERQVPLNVLARYSNGPATRSALHRPARPGLFFYLGFSLFRGFRLLRQDRGGVLLCAGIVDAPVAFILSRVFGRPFILLAHGADIERRGRIYRAVTRFFFRRAHAVAANSRYTRDRLESIGVRPERIRVIHPGVLPGREHQARPGSLPEADARPILLTVGRVIRRKGIGEFITHALPELVRRFPGLLYIVAGDDAADSLIHRERLLDRLRRQTLDSGLSNAVLFAGRVSGERLRDFFRKADVFVLPVIPIPGDVEGFGIVVQEAALHGVPAVAARIGGVPDAVVDGHTGILVPPRDWDGFVEAVSLLLSDEARRRAMGAAAKDRALKEFHWDRISLRYLDLVRDTMRTYAGKRN